MPSQSVVPVALYRVGLICAYLQFTHALEYMMFNPIFVFMAATFSVPVSWAGYVTGIYTLASMVSGLSAWWWIDKWNKRRFLGWSMLLLALLTMAITLSDSFVVLMVLRCAAGVIGGISMGVASAVLINDTPVPLRPKMLALVIASFSIVSIIGMPVMLWLCEHMGWHSALWLIGGLCLVSLPLIHFGLPADTSHLQQKPKPVLTGTLIAYASASALTQFSPMLVIPVLVPLLLIKMQVPESMLPAIFLTGGVVGFIATKLSAKLITWLSGTQLSLLGTVLLIISLILIAQGSPSGFWFISLFLGAAYCRLVAASAVVVNYPSNETRASFNMLQSALMSLSTAVAFFLSSWMLSGETISDDALNQLLWVAGMGAVLLPLFLRYLTGRLAAETKTEIA